MFQGLDADLMRRRTMLGLLGTAAVGSAGCTRPFRNEFRLHFVRIHNSRSSEADIGIRVLRDGEVVFENDPEPLPGMDARNEEHDVDDGEMPDLDYLDELNVRVIEAEWDDDPAVYDLEYAGVGQESWTDADFDDPETVYAALNITINREFFRTPVGVQPLEFEDRDQVNYLLDREYRNETESQTSVGGSPPPYR